MTDEELPRYEVDVTLTIGQCPETGVVPSIKSASDIGKEVAVEAGKDHLMVEESRVTSIDRMEE